MEYSMECGTAARSVTAGAEAVAAGAAAIAAAPAVTPAAATALPFAAQGASEERRATAALPFALEELSSTRKEYVRRNWTGSLVWLCGCTWLMVPNMPFMPFMEGSSDV